MSCNCDHKFGRVSHFGLSPVINKLEKNIKAYLDWAFLGIGAWSDIPASGTVMSELRQTDYAAGYTTGEAWEARRKHWVYESAEYTDMSGVTHSPVDVEVYVDSVLMPSGYDVDYVNGRVIFETPVSSTSTVTAKYPFRNVQVYIGDEQKWWQTIQERMWDLEGDFFEQAQCGEWIINQHHRIQLPCVVITSRPSGSLRGYGLGEACVKRTHSVDLHVLAEDKCTRDNIVDILVAQSEKCVCLYDTDAVTMSGENPLDCNGFHVGDKDFPELVEYFPWTITRPENARISAIGTLQCGLYEGIVSIDYILIC